MEFVSFS